MTTKQLLLFKREVFPQLERYHAWWYRWRDHDRNGLRQFREPPLGRVGFVWGWKPGFVFFRVLGLCRMTETLFLQEHPKQKRGKVPPAQFEPPSPFAKGVFANLRGLCEFGATGESLQNMKWESGMDNAVRFDKTALLRNGPSAWSADQETED